MLFSHVWSENAALFERVMEIYSNLPIHVLYYGFNNAITDLSYLIHFHIK